MLMGVREHLTKCWIESKEGKRNMSKIMKAGDHTTANGCSVSVSMALPGMLICRLGCKPIFQVSALPNSSSKTKTSRLHLENKLPARKLLRPS